MKKVLFLLFLSFSSVGSVYSMCTATCDCSGGIVGQNCPETAANINACGTAFTVTAASMQAANGMSCCAHAACGAGYCSGDSPDKCLSYDNFDCNTSTEAPSPQVAGDDFQGTTENTQFWEFTPGESCSYTLEMCNTNCVDQKAGGCTQFQLFSANAPLPSGTIIDRYGGSANWCGCTTVSFTATAGRQVYLAIDGNSGASCDVSVTLTPSAACTGCILLADDGYTHLRAELSKDKAASVIKWNNLSQENTTYMLEKSYEGRDFYPIKTITSSALVNEVIDDELDLYRPLVYYRLSKLVNGEKKSSAVEVLSIKSKKIKSTKVFDIYGKEYSENNLPSGIIIYVTEFEDGHIESRKEYNTGF
jgi:hypothetical protein